MTIRVVVRGREYDILQAEATARGLTPSVLAYTILREVLLTDAVDMVLAHRDVYEAAKEAAKEGQLRIRKHKFKGQMLRLSEIAAQVGMSYTTLRNRMDNLGISVEQAIEIGPPKAKLESIVKRAIAAGINPATVHHRIRRGWSVERALSVPPMKAKKLDE